MSEIFQSSLSSLKLYNFRNHQVIKFAEISSNSMVITGANGVGKTNILEAISLITPSKGLRGAKIAELNNQANPEHIWSITAGLRTIYGPKEIVTMRNLRPNSKTDSRLVQIDGQLLKKKSELSELINIVWLTPPMQQLFIGSSSDRRSFFDQMVSNFFADHSSHLSKYEQSMRERLRLLKNQQNDDYWLSALEQNMFNQASIISDARMKTLGALFDLSVIFKDKAMPAKLCSTGEQKALLFNLILAQAYALIAKFKVIPILLFDEIISHLDTKNRTLLFEEIFKLKAQSWLTGIDPKSFAQIENKASFIHLG